jgi:hypothetical protein
LLIIQGLDPDLDPLRRFLKGSGSHKTAKLTVRHQIEENTDLALLDGLVEQVDELLLGAVLGQQQRVEARVSRRKTIRVGPILRDDQF